MRKTHGFTLLELLLASVLLAVLMVGVLSVITNVVQPAEAAAQQGEARNKIDSAQAFADLLREDIEHASVIDEVGARSIAFIGHCGFDPVTNERAQRPVRVRYFIEDVDGVPWVFRSEQPLDTEAKRDARRALVGAGVTRFELIAPQRDALQEGEADDDAERPSDAVWRLRVWGDDEQTPAVDRQVVLSRSVKRSKPR
ncbi:MAG: prepilin-type N-terminal cleavage/methylation domain-containing protein [Phycisphaeraceae bacterium]